ncbi:hypothetical protein ATANTOWER_027650 [Ataeniobius toweri]|uniref:Uncharacterized protein n=1 Tax=Ataeniobius toweri TaxID=208326 RepID=A0ABU7BKW2_9TELE|nr:hypothetical protein [Ataeniobius toweri]
MSQSSWGYTLNDWTASMLEEMNPEPTPQPVQQPAEGASGSSSCSKHFGPWKVISITQSPLLDPCQPLYTAGGQYYGNYPPPVPPRLQLLQCDTAQTFDTTHGHPWLQSLNPTAQSTYSREASTTDKL